MCAVQGWSDVLAVTVQERCEGHGCLWVIPFIGPTARWGKVRQAFECRACVCVARVCDGLGESWIALTL